MMDFKGGIKGLRTNLLVLSISASTTLVGVLVVSYGGSRILMDPSIPQPRSWSSIVIALGVGGVLMFIAKSIVRPRWLRWAVGSVSLAPILVLLAAAVTYRALPLMAFEALALICVAYSLCIQEPKIESTTRSSLRFFAAAVLAVLAPLTLAFPQHISLPFGTPVLWMISAVGAVGAGLHLFRPNTPFDRIAGWATGAVFLAISIACFGNRQMMTALTYLPPGIVLLLLPLFRQYRLGSPDPAEGLSEENRIVRQFESLSELIAWAVFLFTYLHIYLQESSGGISGYVFWTFVACYVVFTVQFRMFPPSLSTFRRLYVESMINVLLLALICHVTGGLSSPYGWFFLFVILSGSAAPEPRKILDRLYLIMGYYAFETAYSERLELLNKAVIVNGLLLPVFIIGLTGLYAYQISSRRRQIDAHLTETNLSYKEALERETEAKELIVKQADEIGLARKRDEALLSSLADAVVATGPDGLITLVNPVAETMLSYRASEIVGKRLRDLLLLKREDDPAFRIGAYVDTGLKGNAVPLPDGVYAERQDGRRVYYTGMILPILDAEKRPNGAVAVMRDATYVREIDQMKSNFLSVAAHQLRTPLSTIRWYLELLNDPDEGRLNKDQKSFAENAYTSLLRMVGLVNRLLAITRLEAERVPVRPQPTDLKELTDDILAGAERRVKEHDLDVSVSVFGHLPKVALDPTLAREVFVNLIENAIRYTPKGGSIAIDLKDAGDELIWSIKDDGIGIPKAQQEKIFEKFFRASNAVDFSSEGSGLGLYLARFIVETWGGKLSFESEEDKGAVFRVTVPKAGMKARSGQVSLNA